MSTLRLTVGFFLLAGALAVGLRVGNSYAADDVAAARADAKTARRQAAIADEVAGRALSSALEARLASRKDSVRAAEAARRLAAARREFAAASTAAPDTCDDVVAAAELALAEADSVIVAERARADTLQAAVDTLAPALLNLRIVTGTLSYATNQLEEATRPSLLSRIPLPRFSPLAVTAGIDPFSGEFRMVVGVSVSFPF